MTAFEGHTATAEQVSDLFKTLAIMRPHGSDMEDRFLDTYVRSLDGATEDKCGNIAVRVGKDCPVMWSCHVDTVHNFGGIAPVKLCSDGYIRVHPKSRANCLGADDGAGVWLMTNMVKAGKPGLYVFHRGEEQGCIGSRWFAKNTPERLKGIEAAIAFDRKDVSSIITHQWGGRCCSEDFSKSLADAIGLGMKSDSTGTVTDTAQYTDLIGECTNVSVGYKGQHGKTEEQNLPFLLSLLDRLLDLDIKSLVYKRKPGDVEKKSYNNGGNYYGGHRTRDFSYATDPKLKWEHGKDWSVKEQGYVWPEASGKVWDGTEKKWVMGKAKNARNFQDTNKNWKAARVTEIKTVSTDHNVTTTKYDTVITPETYLRLVKDFPEEIALILSEKDYGMGYLHDRIRAHGGKVVTRFMKIEDYEKLQCPKCERIQKFCACQS